VKSVAELVALAKAKPGTLTYASSGQGTPVHLAAEMFRVLANIDVVHVPYTRSRDWSPSVSPSRRQPSRRWRAAA
jgi:tripartite-type tricarboxylate transporter receptor subunit TctC